MEEAGKQQQEEATMEEGRLDQFDIPTFRVKLKKMLPDNKTEVVKEEGKAETVKKVKPETESDVPRKVLEKIEKKGSEMSNQNCDEGSAGKNNTSPIKVTQETVEFLFRNDGEGIRKIKKEFGVKFKIINREGERMKRIKIEGPEEARRKAEEAVREIVGSMLEQSSMFDITRDNAGFLLRHGNINKLAAEHCVRISIKGEVKDRRRTVVIRGEEGRRARVVEELRRILASRLEQSCMFDLTRNAAIFLLRDGKLKELRRKHGVQIVITGDMADKRRKVMIMGEEGQGGGGGEEDPGQCDIHRGEQGRGKLPDLQWTGEQTPG